MEDQKKKRPSQKVIDLFSQMSKGGEEITDATLAESRRRVQTYTNMIEADSKINQSNLSSMHFTV